MAKIDLAAYVAKIEADTSGLNAGLDSADGLIKGKIGGMVDWSKVAITGMVAGVVAGIGVTIKKGVDSFIEFENQMNSVYTLLPDITEGAMSQMEQQVKDLSTQMGVLPNELIPALYSSISASVPEENVFAFLETAQKGAIAGMTEAETVVDGLTTVLNSYHMEATQADKVSDILFSTIKFGKTSMEELSHSMSTVTPISASLGVEFEDIGAALATMTAQGNATSTSTTQLRQMLTELSKAGGETSGIFESMAGKTFKEFIAEGNNLNDALKLMEKYAKENNVEINDLFGSVQAGSAALMLTGESTEMFVNNLENMSNSAGATQQAYETMDQGIGRSFEKIKVAMSGMILDLGEKLSPMVASATDYTLEAMPTISSIVETTFNVIGDVIKGFVIVIDWLVENITQFVLDNEMLFNSVFETIKDIFNLIIGVVNKFIELFKVYWNQYGEYVMSYITIVWDTVSSVFKGTLEVIKGILNFFINAFKGDWQGMGEAIKNITSGLWEIIKSLFNGSINYIKNIMNAAIEILTNIARNIMMGIHDGFKFVWDIVTQWFSEIFETLFEWFGEKVKGFFDIGHNMFDWMWNGMKSIWSSIKSWVSDTVSWLTDKLTFWRSSKAEMEEPIDIPQPTKGGRFIPSYDVGTPFVPRDGLAFIHEGEMIIPSHLNPANPANKGKSKEITSTITENHYHINKLELPNANDFDSFIKDFNRNLTNLPNKATMKVKKIGRI